MKRSMHAGASQDVADAVGYYMQSAGAHVAARFLNEFERVVDEPNLFMHFHIRWFTPYVEKDCVF